MQCSRQPYHKDYQMLYRMNGQEKGKRMVTVKEKNKLCHPLLALTRCVVWPLIASSLLKHNQL